MRLGVLPFGDPFPADLDDPFAPLRAEDVDIVTADAAITTPADAAREARRLARAECDGVLLMAGADPDAARLSAEAALFLAGTPLLLSCLPLGALFDAAGPLDALGVAYDRLYPVSDLAGWAEKVAGWLRENARRERQRGSEAAHRLYGSRLYVPPAFDAPDAVAWAHRFGVRVSRDVETADDADFAADDGDADGALTRRLLRLVTGPDAPGVPFTVTVTASRHSRGFVGGAGATFARISRRAGRYRCLLLRGALREAPAPDADPSVPPPVFRYDCDGDALYAVAASPLLHGLLGDHLGALRAACDALDIDAVVLR